MYKTKKVEQIIGLQIPAKKSFFFQSIHSFLKAVDATREFGITEAAVLRLSPFRTFKAVSFVELVKSKKLVFQSRNDGSCCFAVASWHSVSAHSRKDREPRVALRLGGGLLCCCVLRHSCRRGHWLDHRLSWWGERRLSLLGPWVCVWGGWGCRTFEFVRTGASSWWGPLLKREREKK